MFRILLSAAAIAGALVVSGPTAAFADGYLDEATQALQTSAVYVSPQVNDLSAEQQTALVSEIGSSDIAIVVLPEGARSEIGDIPTFIGDIASRTGYHTVLVSVGSDFEAGSSALPSGVASQLANEAEHAGNLAGGLKQFVSEVASRETHTSTSTGSDLMPYVMVGTVGLVAATLVVSGILFLFRRRTRHTAPKAVSSGRDKTPGEIKELLTQIDEWTQVIDNRIVSSALTQAEGHVREFFRRAIQRVPDQIQQVTAQYKVTLKTVLQVAERYSDIEQHNLYYKDPKQLLEAGESAIEQYRDGVIQNIQELEAGSLTDFTVDTKILKATYKAEEPDYLSITNPIESTKRKKEK